MDSVAHGTLARPVAHDARDRTPIRVASVPSGHVYVAHLSDPDHDDGVHRLPDPRPDVALPLVGQWWPPVMLSAAWVREHRQEFDVLHVQFGFDAQDPSELRQLVEELRRWDKPLVYTVHDLRNPHHRDRDAHDAHLDVLIPAAAALITLTEGAAEAIRVRWAREALVLPHPHVVDFARMREPRPPHEGFVVGVHVKSLRASMDPGPVIEALGQTIADLPAASLRVNAHRDVMEPGGARYRSDLAEGLRAAARRGSLELAVHDCFSDAELWDYLQGLDLSVLPYRFGTHSGWLEACRDLGTAVLAPTCGFLAEQGPCLTYRHDEDGMDAGALCAAVRAAYEQRPSWRADPVQRQRERRRIAGAHRELYRRVLG